MAIHFTCDTKATHHSPDVFAIDREDTFGLRPQEDQTEHQCSTHIMDRLAEVLKGLYPEEIVRVRKV